MNHWMSCVTNPRLEVRLRNRRVDKSGSLPARSRNRIQKKNPTNKRAPMPTKSQTGEMPPWGMTTVLPMVKFWLAVNQPYVPDCRMPSTTKTSPAAERIVPTISNFGLAPCTPGSWMLRLSTMIKATIRTCKMKEARQLIAVVMTPPMSGPAAAPIPAAALMTPKALARVGRSRKETVHRI